MEMNRAAVLAAARRLHGQVRRTPVLRNPVLDAMAGAALWLKAENLQHIGAFKARGALHAVSRLSAEERSRGIITYSSGNHAQAVALAARRHGIRARIAMPEDAPRIKVDAVRALGAEIVFAGTTSSDRRRAALVMQQESGSVIIEPFDHPDIIAGQGTATLELLEDVAGHGAGLQGDHSGDHSRDQGDDHSDDHDGDQPGAGLDALLVPVGGGGLIAGACLACQGTNTRVYSVEPVGCDAMAQSLARGERVTIDIGPTLADGLRPSQVGAHNFAIARQHLAGSFTVDDHELGRALAALAIHAKVVVEPSGAAALAVALRGDLLERLASHVAGRPARVGVLLSGGNLEPRLLAELVAKHGPELTAG